MNYNKNEGQTHGFAGPCFIFPKMTK